MIDAKKLSKAEKEGPEAVAALKAEALFDLRGQLKRIEAEISELEEDLRDYVVETGDTSLGPLTAYERTSPPKMVGASGKSLETHQQQLLNQFPSYGATKLDLNQMYAAVESDPSLRDALKARGLQIVRTSQWYFKAQASDN